MPRATRIKHHIHAPDQAYTYTFPTQGTGRAQEALFRLRLREWLEEWGDALLPEWLEDEALTHLTHSDGLGLTLCFAGPQREVLLEGIGRWLGTLEADIHGPALAAFAAVLDTSRRASDPPLSDLPEMVRVPTKVPAEAPGMPPGQGTLFDKIRGGSAA